jgi:hypothetical protein
MSQDPKWKQPDSPPPRMFANQPERDLVKQINQELLERIVGSSIVYFPVSLEATTFHPIYGEAINKTFSSPIHVYALVDFKGHQTETGFYGLDRRSTLTVHFFKRRLTEDQELFVREGDFLSYNNVFYEIMKLNEPAEMFGNTSYKVEISAECARAREGTFNLEANQ